jgi:hypothetical protein
VNSGSAYTIPDVFTNGQLVRIALTANTTITLPSPTLSANQSVNLTVRVTQDAGGSKTLAWAAGGNTIDWGNNTGSTAPTPCTGANQSTIYQFLLHGGETQWYATEIWRKCIY